MRGMPEQEEVTNIRVARTGLASFLFAVLRPQQAKAVTVDEKKLQLEYGFRSSEISLGKIKSAEINAGWFWSRIQLRYDRKEAAVSGLSPKDTQAFVKALEVARVHWWQRTLASQIGILQSVYDRLVQLADPFAYLRFSTFNELRHETENAAGQSWTFCKTLSISGQRPTPRSSQTNWTGHRNCSIRSRNGPSPRSSARPSSSMMIETWSLLQLAAERPR